MWIWFQIRNWLQSYSIGILLKLQKKSKETIPLQKKLYRDYLDNTCRSSFFFTPTTPDEVKSIIKSLHTGKATGPYSITHQLLNALLTEISTILSEIFNKSFKTGFLKLLNMSKSYQFSKIRDLHSKQRITDQFLFYQMLTKFLKNSSIKERCNSLRKTKFFTTDNLGLEKNSTRTSHIDWRH